MNIGLILGGAALAMSGFVAQAAEEQHEISQKAIGDREISFKDDVQPILYDYCVNCHSLGGRGHAKSGLDLTSYEGVMKGTVYGKVVIPGNSDVSTFTKLLTGTNKGLKMPMGLNASGTLSREYILVLRKWVDQGAKDN